MKKIRNFKCSECNTRFERMVTDDVLIVNCECGGEAKRQLSAPRYFGATTGRSSSLNYRKG